MTKKIRLTRPGSDPIRDRERKIEAAIKALSSSATGKDALQDLAQFLENHSLRKLTLGQSSEMMLLLREFFIGNNLALVDQVIRAAKKS